VISYPDRRYYERVARTSGFGAAVLERVYRLAAVLDELRVVAGGELLLRGGTALNLLHLAAPRLSVDLDLDYVGSADAAQAQRCRPELLREIEELAVQAGYRVEHSRPSYAMAHLLLRYQNVSGRGEPLKLDINFLDRVPVLEPIALPLQHPFGDDLATPDVLTLTLSELTASKIVALARRGLARDLFDVAQLARLPRLDEDAMRSALVVRGAAYPPPSPRGYSPDAGMQVRPSEWRSQVVALARRDQAVSLPDAQRDAAALLRRSLALRPQECRFLHRLDEGVLDADLLENPSLAARARINPGLLWRVQQGVAGLEER